MSFTPPPENLIRDKFSTIISLTQIDSGGFKIVYRADIQGHWEAFKLILIPSIQSSEENEAYRVEMIGRIKREIDAIRSCQVPEIVKLGSIEPTMIKIGDLDYIAYTEEYLDGSDLWKLLRQTSDYPDELELRLLFISLLNAIKEMWSHGYIHRDIKPKNVIKLNDSSRPFVLLDLGIAYSVQDTALTYNPQYRLPPGTLRYLAPEMLDRNFRQNLDFRSDLYTAAITVYEYATKQHPLALDREDLLETISRILRTRARPIKELRSDISVEFSSYVDQMLKKAPVLRPANINRIIQEIGR